MLRRGAKGALNRLQLGRAASGLHRPSVYPATGSAALPGGPSEARRFATFLADSSSGSRSSLASEERVVTPKEPVAQTTIFALATPPGKAGVAVFRVSGPAVQDVLDTMIFPVGSRLEKAAARRTKPPPARRMVMRDVRVPTGETSPGEVIDEGLVVYFEAGKSFTNEPLLELHLHSSPAITSLVLSSLGRLPALRPAERGEFTKRAFLSGRLDLTEVEGLRDLIEGETEIQRRLARQGMTGAVGRRFESLRERVVGAMAQADALIDFGEDDAIGDEAFRTAQDQVAHLIREIRAHLADAKRGELLREGVKVSIFGPPNAGKSSLLNMLSQRDVAIVSPVPGTTRDVVSVALDLDGIKAVLSDTAGLRSTTDAVEQIGISRAAASVGEADLKVLVFPLPPFAYPWTDVTALLEEELVLPHVDGETIVLFNQVDLLPPSFAAASGDATPPNDAERARRLAESVVCEWMPAGPRWWVGSVETGEGMDAFLEHGLNAAVKRKALLDREGAEELPLVSSARQRYHLERALSHLLDFGRRDAPDVILASEALRRAASEIGNVSGRAISAEDVLDKLFGDFCIGK